MKAVIKYRRFFAYSETNNKCFYTVFSDGFNIIYGKNTSGKSTLIQSINYMFGINDEKHKLKELLQEGVIFRLDFELTKETTENVTVIRDTDFIYIKIGESPVLQFSGISSDNSQEHIMLKEYLSELFGFNLYLESKGEYKIAPIEVMFLPYYVSQDYGWVLALKSFRNLDFYKNFKVDYYDYYLGIINDYDRLEKQKLENNKRDLESEINFLSNVERKSDTLQLAKLKDETFVNKSAEYVNNNLKVRH